MSGRDRSKPKATREKHERDATVWSRVVAAEWQRSREIGEKFRTEY